MREDQARTDLLNYCHALNKSGLSAGRSGNISLRLADKVLISPSGMDYQQLRAADMVAIDLAGNRLNAAEPAPSSEWHFHCAIYRARADIDTVVHAHPTYCTALACTGRTIPAFHYMVALAGGDDIPIADYAIYGSDELANHIVHALRQRQACLLANHGMVAIATQLPAAFHLALEVENLAQQYCEALKLGDVKLLTSDQMQAVLLKFQHYGQRV